MIISATGVVFDHYGDVLLIQRDDTRTLAPPGGAAEINELPLETVVREVKEETGLIVMPVRLVGIYYLPTKPNDYLSFCFRCIMRGGELETSTESPRAGFFKTNPLPKPMLNLSRERVLRSMTHQGGTPYWGIHQLTASMKIGNLLLNSIVYPWFNLRRKFTNKPPHKPPPHWQISVRIIVRDNMNRILWIKDPGNGTWHLPEGASLSMEPPWLAATRILNQLINVPVKLVNLLGVFVINERPEMILLFEGDLSDSVPDPFNDQIGLFISGEEPDNALTAHKQHVTHNLDNHIQYQLINS